MPHQVRMNVQTRWHGRVLVPGELALVPPDVAHRWATRGIAEPINAPPEPTEPTAPTTATVLPDDFPARELLVAYGLDTLEIVRGMSEADLVALKGIGKARARAILDAA